MVRITKIIIKADTYIEFFLNLSLTLMVCSVIIVLRQVRERLFLFPVILLAFLNVCSGVFVLAAWWAHQASLVSQNCFAMHLVQGETDMSKSVLLAIDGSHCGAHALQHILALTDSASVKVVLAYVIK